MSAASLRTGFVRKSFLRLSWPLVVVTFVTLLAVLANVAILSMASEQLNAATATANQAFGVLYDISVIFSIGALVVIAQYLGAQLRPTSSMTPGRTCGSPASASSSMRSSWPVPRCCVPTVDHLLRETWGDLTVADLTADMTYIASW